ncbi:MAG TPA: TolC family protein [Tepidisphaeraceae bacterium]|jgi:outer membrane protein TolC
MKRLAWVALGCALLLTGCAVDQQQEVNLYRQILNSNVPPLPEPGPQDPLSLDTALALTNQNNEQLGLRGEDYVQALINKNRAVAAFLPTVSFQPNFTIEQRPSGNASSSTGPGGTGIGTGTTGGGTGTGSITSSGGFRNHGDVSTRFEAPVVGNINLFRGFSDLANLKSAEWVIEQRRQILLDAQNAVLLNAAQVYYQVLRSERQLEVLRNSLKVQEARVTDEEGRFKNGLSTRLAVAQTRAQADATRASVALAEGDVANGRSVLALIVGLPRVPNPLVDDFKVPDERPPEDQFEAAALANRQDLLAAKAQMEAARHAVDAAIGEYYPSVSLNVAGFLYREFYTDASKWNAILTANLPIFSAGIIEADVRNAWSRLRQAALFESQVRRQALNDVQLAYQNLLTSERRIKDLADAVAAADEALKQAQAALANNLAIVLDVLTAQDQLLNAQLQLTGAQFDRTIFYLNLLRATGELTQHAARKP